MNSVTRILYGVFIGAILLSCNKTKDLFRPPLEIELSVAYIEMDNQGGSQVFTIKSNYDWSIVSSDSQFKISPSSGVKDKSEIITITGLANTDVDKQFVLTIISKDEQRLISGVQKGSNYAKTASNIVVTTFDILPEFNHGVYIPVSFVNKINNQYVFSDKQEINYYQVDLLHITPSWTSNAVKVTVDNAIQTSSVSQNNFAQALTYRFYAVDNTYKEVKVQLTNPRETWTGLPLLVLNTDNNTDITSKEIWSNGRFVLDPQGNIDIQALQGMTEIRGRGNSTWTMPKKPFALKLKEKSEGIFMGMKAHKRWALLANYADKTSLRNRIAFELGKKVDLAWTPDSRFVDVILNGKFLGNYLLTEQIKIDKNRVNIAEIDNKETSIEKITGGWLMEIDRFYSNGETRYFRPALSQIPIIVKEPEDANSQQMDYIADYFNTLEKTLFPSLPSGISYNKSNAHLGGTPDSTEYAKYINVGSFINYWIVQELTENRDSRLPGSVYMFKDVNKKVSLGPLWDFDQTTFLGSNSWLHYDYVPSDEEYNNLAYRSIYFNQLFKDPKFRSKVKERWAELYPVLLNDMPKFIDNEYKSIAKSLEINWIDVGEQSSQGIWSLSDDEIVNGGRNHDKNLKSADAVSRIKDNLIKRINWMNNQINAW